LIPLNARTTDEQRCLAAKGGKASGKARRQRKVLLLAVRDQEVTRLRGRLEEKESFERGIFSLMEEGKHEKIGTKKREPRIQVGTHGVPQQNNVNHTIPGRQRQGL
jgi:hypothetical protein